MVNIKIFIFALVVEWASLLDGSTKIFYLKIHSESYQCFNISVFRLLITGKCYTFLNEMVKIYKHVRRPPSLFPCI